jgi:hypothetical protein
VVYWDTSGKLKSDRAYYYYSVFVDRKDHEKIVICHVKKSHLPIVSLQYTVRVGTCPRFLILDGEDEVNDGSTTTLDSGLQTWVANMRDDHQDNDPTERVIQELDTMMKVSIHESNIPFKEWCFVVEYMCLIDMITSYSTSNRSKAIFEDVYGFTPDVEFLPVVGCFASRLEETKARTDKKFVVRTSVCTFVGFVTYRVL